MTSIIGAIRDDEDEYLDLCKHYREEPRRKLSPSHGNYIDCYGDHAAELKKRYQAELKAKQQAR